MSLLEPSPPRRSLQLLSGPPVGAKALTTNPGARPDEAFSPRPVLLQHAQDRLTKQNIRAKLSSAIAGWARPRQRSRWANAKANGKQSPEPGKSIVNNLLQYLPEHKLALHSFPLQTKPGKYLLVFCRHAPPAGARSPERSRRSAQAGRSIAQSMLRPYGPRTTPSVVRRPQPIARP
jgi:hypothetical protein